MKKNSTKKALLLTLLSLVVCVSLFIGTTFAWFTDSVTSANNIIKSGNLDVTFEWMDGTEDVADADSNVWQDASNEAIFDYALWEPGYTEVRHIKIGNEGSLALKYKVAIEVYGDIDTSVNLADVIDVYYFDPAQKIADRTALTADNYLGTLSAVLGNLNTTAQGTLLAGDDDVLTLALKMQETAGNEYMDKEIGASFAVKLYATQLTAEEDSFDDQYDKDATYPVISNLAEVNPGFELSLKTEDMTVEAPAALVDALDGVAEKVELRHSEPKFEADAIVFDSADVFNQNDQIIDLEAMGNTVPLTVTLYVGDKFAADARVKIFHDGEEVAAVRVDANGYITYEVLHFCEIVVARNTDPEIVKVNSTDELLAAFENFVPGNVIDATGVVVTISTANHFNIPANVTLKGLTVNASYRGISYVMCGDNVVLEDCSFGNSNRTLVFAGIAESSKVTVNNSMFSGAIIINFHDNQANGEMFLNNCTFTKSGSTGYSEAMGGTHYFNNCTFDYTGIAQSSMGVINTGSFNVYSEDDYIKTNVVLTGCKLINCGTRKYGSKSTLTIK